MMPNLPIVGIGASAGGVEALEQFFKSLRPNNGLAVVVVTHLPPDRESMLSEILGRATRMPVVDARDGDQVEAGHVYVLPPSAILTIHEARLQLRRTGPADRERAPIDIFFNSLAEDQGEHAIGIVLSGTGHDGTLGLKAIKEHGGLTIAQGSNVTRPRFAEMPSSAVNAGIVDLELPVDFIPERIIGYVRNWGAFDAEPRGDALTTIYALLRTRTGHDFSEYKDRTFQRRVQRRMQVVQTTKLEDYAALLQREPDEVNALFRDLLIGVTDFFRDAAAFQALEREVPKLFEGKGADDEVRVWVAGCATGEEAYSIAILLREHLEKSSSPPKVQVFATDIDETAMGVARAARYPASVVKQVSPERLRRFFVHEAGTYRVVNELRDMCIFSSHSVIRDPPFSRLDLISCRNLLIYLKPSLQAQVIPLFHYSLRPGGYLFLGSSENVSRHSELFTAFDRKNRIFRRRDLVARPSLPLQQFLPHWRRGATGSEQGPSGLVQRSDTLRRVANTIVEHFAPIYVIVDESGQTLYFASGTGKYLQPAAGPPNRDIVAMARPGLRADLRTALQRAKETGQRVVRDRIHVQINGGVQIVRIAVEPVIEGKETAYGIVFTDRAPIRTEDEIADAEHPQGQDATVQHIEKELQETKERLQSTIEELETANEEFRSSNEELLSVNEELQSTNEELETSKEELQSVNEELQTVNHELTAKIDELDHANSDLYNLFQSTQIATIFLDRNLVIRSFTPPSIELFNLIPGDRGRPLTDIVSRIDYPELETDMRRVCAAGDVAERSVSIPGGTRHYLARVLPYRSATNAIDGVLLTFVDVTSIVAAEEQQKVLAAELSHRVKNTLAVVSSIAERTLPDGESKTDLIGRFHALGHTHEVLSAAGWTEAGLRELILAELSPHAIKDAGNVQVGGPPVMLKPQAALFLALAIHELSTNAAKYGALSVTDGRVDVTWSMTGDHPHRLEISWQEQGGPKTDGLGTAGFGTELIERGIRFELQGEAKLEVVNGGLHCRIAIPANPHHLTFGSRDGRQSLADAAS
jgi:two-component system, chemotaxis family, CheB/CheR fusion protein